MSRRKSVGYFAYLPGGNVICDGDSCVIAGSRKKMKKYLDAQRSYDTSQINIKKARFEEIRKGMELGAAYSFDEEAYNRFYPMAQKAGIGLGPEDFSEDRPGKFHFVRVQHFPVSSNYSPFRISLHLT